MIRGANLLAMAVALALAMASSVAEPAGKLPAADDARAVRRGLRVVRLPSGERALLDVGGYPVPLRDYQRIVSGSTVADELLLALCEPSRIAGFTVHSAENAVQRYRFAGRPTHDGLRNVEQVLALQPDLVVAHALGNAQAIARLRELGVPVFDMGEMRGLRTLETDIYELGLLLGDLARGEDYAQRFERRMAGVARGLAPGRRKRALYVAVYGDKLYGGTVGTSYHDVLVTAGLHDVAAERYRDWPAYTAEVLLALDPEWIVTSAGMGDLLCARPSLDRLRACRGERAIAELDANMTSSAGPQMADAAEQLFALVYGESPGAQTPVASRVANEEVRP